MAVGIQGAECEQDGPWLIHEAQLMQLLRQCSSTNARKTRAQELKTRTGVGYGDRKSFRIESVYALLGDHN